MKLFFSLCGILAILFATYFIYTNYSKRESSPQIAQKQSQIPTDTITLDGKKYQVLIADDPNEWEKGLMNIRTLENADGMIFKFPQKEIRPFWNKNTIADLDIYWLSDNEVVGTSQLPSIEKSKQIVIVTSPQPVNNVVEIIRK